MTALALFVFQQFSGINAIVYYSSSVFRQAGIDSANLASAAVGLANVIGTLIAGRMLDKEGRKPLLSRSLVLMAGAMGLLAAGMTVPALSPYSATIAMVSKGARPSAA